MKRIFSSFIISSLFALIITVNFSCVESTDSITEEVQEEENEEQVRDTVDVNNAQWPISQDREQNSDLSYAQFGPRHLPSGYDFHAGIDLPADRGTPVYPVLPGEVVETDHWTGSGSAGNAITVKHADTLATSYLHLDDISVDVGDWVNQGDMIGRVGSTGASYNHLHLGFFENLPNPNQRDERYSKNPLEILPYDQSEEIHYTFSEQGIVTLNMPLQSMTTNSIELIGEEESRKADYYDIVAKGWSDRKEKVQFELYFDVDRRTDDHQRFNLFVGPQNMDFTPKRIIVQDFNGTVILDATNDEQD